MNIALFCIITLIFFSITISLFLLFRKKFNISENKEDLWNLVIYFSISTILILIWDGRFLLSSKIGILDWKKEIYFYHFLRSSLEEYGKLPLSFIYLPENIAGYPAVSRALSYWANPEVLTFSPLMVFLPFMSVSKFLKSYFYFHLLFGSMGIYILSKRLNLNTYIAIILMSLTVLNPWLMQHLAIGYTPWIQVCLVPMIIAMLVGVETSLLEMIVATILNSLIIYGGGLHVFIWFNFAFIVFIIFSIIFSSKDQLLQRLKKTFIYFLLSGLLIFPKLFATFSVFGDWSRGTAGSPSSLRDLWGLLTDVNAPLYDFPQSHSIYGTDIYDASIVMGEWFVVLFVLSSVYIIYKSLKSQSTRISQNTSLILLFVALFFCVLGWRGVWKYIVELIPMLGVEKYPWRFLFVSLFSIITLVVIEVFNFIDNLFASNKFKFVAVSFLIFLPVLVSIYNRNQYFVDVAITNNDPIPEFAIKSTFKKNRIPISRYKESNINQIIIYPDDNSTILLNWIKSEYVDEFLIQNGTIEDHLSSNNGVIIKLIDKSKPIVIRPKSYGAVPLLVVSLLLYSGVIVLLQPKMENLPSDDSLRTEAKNY